MRPKKIILLLEVVVVILTILLTTGVGYAIETDNTLNISEKEVFVAKQSDFKVRFTGEPRYTGKGVAKLNLTGETTATMNISGLKSVGDSLTTIWEIENKSRDLYADINTSVRNTNTEYFNVTSKVSNSILNPKNGKTTIEITVELIKLPIEKDEKADICINITAKPRYNY